MKNIKHIVYLMLENRSLDQLLGWLYSDSNPLHVLPAGSSPVFNGLNTGNYYNTDKYGVPHPVQRISDPANNRIPSEDPHEDYVHVNFQLYSSQANPAPGAKAQMSGFFKDYADENPDTKQIMQCYDHKGLPYINALARVFAVSDAYFSSIPTQTNCNRGFAGCGNSIGMLNGKSTAMVDNHWWEEFPWDPVEFGGRTIWDVLSTNGFGGNMDWMIYYSQLWPVKHPLGYCYTKDLFWPSLQKYSNFAQINSFFDALKTGNLPTFSFLEPAWYEEVYNGNDYHPPANLSNGEAFLKQIFNSLLSSGYWDSTLLIINFDEHGGTYDHVSPPWGAKAPWANSVDGTHAPAAKEFEFQFDRFGVRVPLILVSPYIKTSTVFRSPTSVPFDHTSVIATVLNHFQIPKSRWQLGSRVANAPTFEFVLDSDEPRRSFPELESIMVEPEKNDNVPANELQRMISYRALYRAAQSMNCPVEKFGVVYKKYFQSVKTVGELYAATTSALEELTIYATDPVQ